jgi:hypothetical protein
MPRDKKRQFNTDTCDKMSFAYTHTRTQTRGHTEHEKRTKIRGTFCYLTARIARGNPDIVRVQLRSPQTTIHLNGLCDVTASLHIHCMNLGSL